MKGWTACQSVSGDGSSAWRLQNPRVEAMVDRRSNRQRGKKQSVSDRPTFPIGQVIGLLVVGIVVSGSLYFAYRPGTASSLTVSSRDRVAVAGAVQGSSHPSQLHPEDFQRCRKVRLNCVVDGDTFWLNGVKIRLVDVDAPEIGKPRCAEELRLGDLATNRLIEFLNAGPFELSRSGGPLRDRFGRELFLVTRDGKSIGDLLVEQGLAHRWRGTKEPWCRAP